MNKFKQAKTFEDLLRIKYGERGTEKREVFEAKAEAFYLCEMLKEKRKDAQISQKSLAEKTALKSSFLSRIENGKVDVQLSTFLKILNSMNMRIEIVET